MTAPDPVLLARVEALANDCESNDAMGVDLDIAAYDCGGIAADLRTLITLVHALEAEGGRRLRLILKAETQLAEQAAAYRAHIATLDRAMARVVAERDRMAEALEEIAQSTDAGRHDGLPEECPALEDVIMWIIARRALAAPEIVAPEVK